MEPHDTDEAVVRYSEYLQQVMRVATLEDEVKRLRALLNRHQHELEEFHAQ